MNRHLVFVDEAGFNLHTRRTRGRAHVGERAVRQIAGCRGQQSEPLNGHIAGSWDALF